MSPPTAAQIAARLRQMARERWAIATQDGLPVEVRRNAATDGAYLDEAARLLEHVA